MLLPLLLLVVAILAAGVVAYGMHPGWMQFSHGLQVILFARRVEWGMIALALIACIALVAVIIAGKRRAWWLIGLAPVMALFLHHFYADAHRAFDVVENPEFIDAQRASALLADDDRVVGLHFGDIDYAYPYAALFGGPVVLQADHDRRMILLWSAYANRVLAFHAGEELKGRDLEIVSMPANAPLLYNSRLGQFINALKGQTVDGQKPAGFGAPIPTTKTTWKLWLSDHPATKVLAIKTLRPGAPTQALLPAYAAYGMPLNDAAAGGPLSKSQPSTHPAKRVRVAVVGTTQPSAVDDAAIVPGAEPLNLHADGEPVLVFRVHDEEPPRALVRRFGDDIRSRFVLKHDAKHPEVMFKDIDTGTYWSASGVAVAGNKAFHGRRLTPVAVDDDVDWAVLKFWYPEMQLQSPQPAPVVTEVDETPTTPAPPGPRPARRGRAAPRRSGAPRAPSP